MWGKGEMYFTVLTLFSSNTYKGEEGAVLYHPEVSLDFVSLAHWWKGNALPIFCTKERTSGAEWCQQAPLCWYKAQKGIFNQKGGWKPARVDMRPCSLILSASETEKERKKVFLNVLNISLNHLGKLVFFFIKSSLSFRVLICFERLCLNVLD